MAVSSPIWPGAVRMPDGWALLPKNSAADRRMRRFFTTAQFAAASGGTPMRGWKRQISRSWMMSRAGTTSGSPDSGIRLRLLVCSS
ncbi:hypothetical protein D9M69_725280 [compost metagenome]